MKDLKEIYLIQFIFTFSLNIAGNFLSIYIYSLKFSTQLIGYVNAIIVLDSVFGVIFSFLFKIFNRRKTFLIYLLILNALSWFILIYPSEIIFLVHAILRAISEGVISVLISLYIFQNTEEKNRIYISSNWVFIRAIAYIISTSLGALIINSFGFKDILFIIPFLLLSLSVVYVERYINFKEIKEFKIIQKIKNEINEIKTDKNYLHYSLLIFSFYFAVGVASGYFSVFLVDKLKESVMTWTVIGIIEMLTFISLKSAIDYTLPKFGERKILIISTFLISLIPLVWVASKNIFIILLFSFISGISWKIFDLASFSYLGKLAENSEFKISFFYLIISIAVSLGNFVGGTISIYGLEIVFYISFLLRFFSSLLFLTLIEQKRKIFIFEPLFLTGEFFGDLFEKIIPKKLKKIKS